MYTQGITSNTNFSSKQKDKIKKVKNKKRHLCEHKEQQRSQQYYRPLEPFAPFSGIPGFITLLHNVNKTQNWQILLIKMVFSSKT